MMGKIRTMVLRVSVGLRSDESNGLQARPG